MLESSKYRMPNNTVQNMSLSGLAYSLWGETRGFAVSGHWSRFWGMFSEGFSPLLAPSSSGFTAFSQLKGLKAFQAFFGITLCVFICLLINCCFLPYWSCYFLSLSFVFFCLVMMWISQNLNCAIFKETAVTYHWLYPSWYRIFFSSWDRSTLW